MTEEPALAVRLRKWVRYRCARIRHKRWAFQNWRNGYKFNAIRRFRCCDHTTPYHYQWCDKRDQR
jgi:hypothetical protein